MDSEYDKKFEEMKKYIPFLESMIKRLESTNALSANPRQAQLDKIRSLRDLLLNKKKRMKMENLLKCEQVLVNLYAKVEQRETLSTKKVSDPGFAIDPPTPQEKSDLEAVRNKFKTVVKRQEEVEETLPEILRGNEVEEVHTAGSKEPALFQRRPNKASTSPPHRTPTKTNDDRALSQSSASKRNYTRVLVSPETNKRRWSPNATSEEKPLFCRRSPRRSPRRYSPSYHKRERKKSAKDTRKSRDLNITLNVPEDSLGTLNTKDLVSRIITCSDGDVDIETLRGLRKQILTELQKTGAKDDISDLLLKSYNKKKRPKNKKKEEVEEGELSDSESEVIENIYGNITTNLVFKDTGENKNSSDKEKEHKIQICLTINSDKDKNNPNTSKSIELPDTSDDLELEMYEKDNKEDINSNSNKDTKSELITINDEDNKISKQDITIVEVNEKTKDDVVGNSKPQKILEEKEKEVTDKPAEPIQFKANFYKPLNESSEFIESNNVDVSKDGIRTQKEVTSKTDAIVKPSKSIEAQLEKMENTTEIPLLNEPTVPSKPDKNAVSEIDILQALKNEILSETITIPGSEAGTPLLHQPKINKVASAKEILPKKRISIEKYKQKTVKSSTLFIDEHVSPKDDQIKKTSLKLTEKECERFNIPKISFDDDSSDGDNEGEIQVSDIYGDLAPKSPDHEEPSNIKSIPVIIPADPVKTVAVNHKADIDMRTLPILSPSNNEISVDKKKVEPNQSRPALFDPRVRREMNSKNSNHSPSPHTGNPDRTPRPVYSNITVSPNTNVALTPTARTYDMTPSHQSFDIDHSNNKHIYVPSFSQLDSRERETSVTKDSRWEKVDPPVERKSRFDDHCETSWSSSDVSLNTRYSESFSGDKNKIGQRNDRYSLDTRDSYSHQRLECPKTPVPSFGRSEGPVTANQTFGRIDMPMTPLHPFGRADCPSTPNHPFGRSECPLTPSHPFGRSECPPTPSHSFGRSECPPTPSHSFGRSECPPTPNHPFGRLDCPPTPNHPFGSQSFNIIDCPLTPTPAFGAAECPIPTPLFGRNECPPTPNLAFGLLEGPQTPNPSFGRSDSTPNLFGRCDFNTQKYTKDPRLNRKSEYESNSQLDERDRGYYKDRGYYRGSSYKSDFYQTQDKEGRNNKYRSYAQDQSGRPLSKDRSKREQNVVGSKDSEFARDSGRYKNETRTYEEVGLRRGSQRERSIGRNVLPDQRDNVQLEDNYTRSSSRARSVGRNSSIEPEHNTLSVKPHAGRSFVIDTSVNATFQSFLDSGKGIEVFEYNNDARRKRAMSVGRSLVRESSVERGISRERYLRTENKREVLRRASSMGRDVIHSATENKSFQEIKADFETYRQPAKEFKTFDIGKIRNIDTTSKNTIEHTGRNKKQFFDKNKEEKRSQSTAKAAYSPRKNYRDPRMRKEYDNRNKHCDKYGDTRARKSGIVYSNDNIVKGAILTSGYGVKNYKIPKIKRLVEEKEVPPKKDEKQPTSNKYATHKLNHTDKVKEQDTIKEKVNDKNRETPKQKTKEVLKEKIKETPNEGSPKRKTKEVIKDEAKSDIETNTQMEDMNKSDDHVEKRLTRSSRRFVVESKTDVDVVTKSKKSKKAVIEDSDSDAGDKPIEKASHKEAKIVEKTSPVKEKNIFKESNPVDIDTNFSLEEIEMFSDSVVSDPVLDNITALIADLDNDLDTSKNESRNDFTKEITLENMMQNITCPPEDNSSQSGEEFSKVLQAVDTLSKMSDDKMDDIPVSDPNDENKINDKIALSNTNVSQDSMNAEDLSTEKSNGLQIFDDLLCTKKTPESASIENNVEEHKHDDNMTADTSLDESKHANEDIVSTSETDQDTLPIEDKSKIDEQNVDVCLTPDSTNNTDEVLEKPKIDEGLADSTNEIHSETNVTSTDSVEPKPSSSHTESIPALELGNFLTILQDKTKIKELLNMLGVQSGDNDKIKKKLEKLSEIVSDDDRDEQPEDSKIEFTDHTDDKNVEMNIRVDEKTEITEEKEKQLDKCGEGDENDVEVSRNDGNAEKIEPDLQEIEEKCKKPVKKPKLSRKSKGRFARKVTSIAEKRVTRATAADKTKQKPKKPTRELQKLHEDIKEMFIREDILSATGIRMCRLAKLVDEKDAAKEDIHKPECEPVVVLEKFKNASDRNCDQPLPEKARKKPGPKPKPKISTDSLPESENTEKPIKYRPGPKSKTKNKREPDPYAFETDSVGDTTTEKASEDDSNNSSDSEICSLASSKSFGSTELLSEIKKKSKRRRRGWQDGVIKPKHKKKKVDIKFESTPEPIEEHLSTEKQTLLPDMNCFTDKNYCFRKNESNYSCRLCAFTGKDIVQHYKTKHPHVEIPLSRMAPQVAREATEQCKEINFQAVSKIASEKYVCIFCFKEFVNNNSVLDTFFWHVVSTHTGEYKHKCSECTSENRCPFSLDIPPPPKHTNGQLIGYTCKKCNFTQLSLENLKTHVIVRHNDEQTAVYTINLGAMSKKTLKEFLRRCESVLSVLPVSTPQEIAAKMPSLNRSKTETRICESEATILNPAKNMSPLTSIQSKITFEADDNTSELSDLINEGSSESTIKIERVDPDNMEDIAHNEPQSIVSQVSEKPVALADLQTSHSSSLQEPRPSPILAPVEPTSQPSNDIVDYPHFKINITDSGAKEYICCINGVEKHFKTTLLISMKKHVQLKHSENWDGYCFVCKVIVMPQGVHRFKDCFQHYLDKHMDNFPILQKEAINESTPVEFPDKNIPIENPTTPKPYIHVRNISELISTKADFTPKETASFPIIQSVVSLGAQSVEAPRPSPTYPTVRREKKTSEVVFKYEEVQAEVMLKKHRVVLETMMARDKLVKVYKCAGRFCSFTSDSAEDALLHASTHQRIGGVDALNCSYCDFDAMGNAIDLVMHVFKTHGHCQYSCGHCFYRAAASQSVGAHMSRVHGIAQSSGTVLRTTTVTTNTAADAATMLTREQAVPYYVCNHTELEGTCKFRTYTPDKFCEHLQQKHVSATSHYCYMCHSEAQSPSELVQHMKSHGLKLYQCTWCVLGADNEAQLLAHVSSVHPGRQPQAYLRIMTNKEGSNELRVLPLAFLNKLKVPTEDVTPSATKENPVREAERSIDLEKLIGLTTFVEPVDGPSEPSPVDTDPPRSLLTTHAVSRTNVEHRTQLETAVVAPVAISRLDAFAGPSHAVDENVVVNIPPVEPFVTIAPVELPQETQILPVKPEPLETPKMLPGEIVVLDSDEEETDPEPEPLPELELEPEALPEPEFEPESLPETERVPVPVPEQPAPKRTAKQPHKQSIIELSDDDPATSTKIYKNKKVPSEILPTCPKCRMICKSISGLKKHLYYCYPNKEQGSECPHCDFEASNREIIMQHYMDDHCDKNIYQCGVCRVNLMSLAIVKKHVRYVHKEKDITVSQTLENGIYCFLVNVARKEKKELPKRKLSGSTSTEIVNQRRFRPQDIDKLPINPILDHLVYCEVCEFSTKVRLNMVRHLQLHAEQQPVAQTAPVNPVPHLETNEKHFDKMVNLASSSVVNRAPEKPLRLDYVPFVPVVLDAEQASKYPRQITIRERNTCAAPGCSYISVDEAMLKRHWDALHITKERYACIHCPYGQSVDNSRPLTGSRIAAHLKMHDEKLYACSKCNFYHYKRDFVEKHILDIHMEGDLWLVRENTAASAPLVPMSTAPTMDLKPWQCGFCKFKSMLRPEVADHCFKFHQSKMQFRCAYCPYRASAVENVQNHLAHSHADEPEEVIYYYYREGTLPDEEDGTPRWVKQRQKMGSAVPEIKTEAERSLSPVASPAPPAVNIDLNLVKKEVEDEVSPGTVESIEELCKRLGEFCEPNGIKYRCPLCKVVMEDTREGMQSHLYEELKYRKWGCGLCSYKAFHKAGLTEHMTSEHRRQYDNIELPTDVNIEKWVTGQLDHQAAIIEQHKTNLAKQKITIERTKPGTSTTAPPTIEAVEKFSAAQLEDAFGAFGAPDNLMFRCPKCSSLFKDEAAMKDHLEMELNKIRWGCTNCSEKYQTYHEAQFHCKGHDGPSRPKEAIRDPSMRAAWVSNIIQTQKNTLRRAPVTPTSTDPPTSENIAPENDNSLLVVRYEERVPTPDLVTMTRKRAAPDSDEERLVIDEPGPKKRALPGMKQCTYCTYKNKNYSIWREHVLKHYNLKPYTCYYCDFSSSRQRVMSHTLNFHPNEQQRMKLTPMPPAAPPVNAGTEKQPEDETVKLICLFCEKTVPETELDTHLHENIRPDFAKKGDVVVKCCICLALRLDVKSLQDHHNLAHPNMAINYALFKLHHDHRHTHYCGHCNNIGFKFMRDLKTHHNAVHSALPFKYTSIPYVLQGKNEDIRKKEDFVPQPLVKRCARKSTTKLPGCKSVAKKSTTKLPYSVPSTSEEGYSYYKTQPKPLEQYANVTTLMYFCNRMMPFTLKKLSEIINIEPKVVVQDIQRQ